VALQLSGQIDFYQINAVFGRGYNLAAYLSTGFYYGSNGSPGNFPPNNISFYNFYGTQPTDPGGGGYNGS
jgi:hypothetical protein